MTLEATTPDYTKKRFRALFFGRPSTYKTYTSIQFPKPYLIDTEGGALHDQYVNMLKEKEGSILHTNDYQRILENVKSLCREKHDFKTLIIDSITIIYNNLVDENIKKYGSDFGKPYSESKNQIAQLIKWAFCTDMNVIFTAHCKKEYGDKMCVIGKIPDCHKEVDYMFDLVIHTEKIAAKRVGYIMKSRVISFNETDHFEFNYENIEKIYGKDNLLRKCKPIELATEEQLEELNTLIKKVKIPSFKTDRWLQKADVTSFEEMEKSNINKCIDYINLLYKKTLQGEKNANSIQ